MSTRDREDRFREAVARHRATFHAERAWASGDGEVNSSEATRLARQLYPQDSEWRMRIAFSSTYNQEMSRLVLASLSQRAERAERWGSGRINRLAAKLGLDSKARRKLYDTLGGR